MGAGESRPAGPSSSLSCTVRGPRLPTFQVVVGRREVEAGTPVGEDAISRALARGEGTPNLYLLRLMLALTRPGDLVADVGAHVGLFALTAAAAGRRALAVEASRRNCELLRRSVEANGFAGLVEVVHAAGAAEPGELRFHESGPFGTVGAPGQAGCVPVRAVRVGDLLAERAGPVGLVKIDVEGYEVEVVEGLSAWLSARAGAPPILYESHQLGHEGRGRSVHALRDALTRLGYRHHYAVYRPLRLTTLAEGEVQPTVVAECLASRAPLTSLPGWAVGGPLTAREFLTLFYEDALAYWGHPAVLSSLGRVFQAAARGHLGHPRVRRYLGWAARHPDPAVREAFAPWAGEGGPLSFAVERLRAGVERFPRRLARELPRLHALPARVIRRLRKVKGAGRALSR
jgi:FkbM family methyltransferase